MKYSNVGKEWFKTEPTRCMAVIRQVSEHIFAENCAFKSQESIILSQKIEQAKTYIDGLERENISLFNTYNSKKSDSYIVRGLIACAVVLFIAYEENFTTFGGFLCLCIIYFTCSLSNSEDKATFLTSTESEKYRKMKQ